MVRWLVRSVVEFSVMVLCCFRYVPHRCSLKGEPGVAGVGSYTEPEDALPCSPGIFSQGLPFPISSGQKDGLRHSSSLVLFCNSA